MLATVLSAAAMPRASFAAPLGERVPVGRESGIVGNGSHDDSAAIMDFLDRNRGKTIIFPSGYRFLAGNLFMSGSGWDGTRIIIEDGCEIVMLPRSGGARTLHGFFALFAFQACDDVGLDVRGIINGNRPQQPLDSHIHLAAFAGVRGFDVPSFRCRDYMGDGLYITSENASTAGRNSIRGKIGVVEGRNSVVAGRNLVSVISLADSTFDTIRGVNVGRVGQPGGFDIEPNNATQLVENIVVGSIDVSGAGSSMVAVHGRPESTGRCKGVVIRRSSVVNTAPGSVRDQRGRNTQNGAFTLRLRWCEDVHVQDHTGRHSASYGNGVEIMAAIRPLVRAAVSHVNTGLVTAASGYKLQTVVNGDIRVDVADVARFGHLLVNITGGAIRGRISDPSDAFYSNRFAVVASGQLKGCVLGQSVASSGYWTRSFRHDGATYSGATIEGGDLSGSNWAGRLQQMGDMPILKRNVRGISGPDK